MAQLFAVKVPAISKHLSNIYENKELEEVSVIPILETTASDGKKYKTSFLLLVGILRFYLTTAQPAVVPAANSHCCMVLRFWFVGDIKRRPLTGLPACCMG
jgi:hypothetical protein